MSDIPNWRDMGASPRQPSGACHPILIVGGGPVGLTLALDLGRKGLPVLLLNKLSFIAGGSKAICFSKRTLDIWDRLDVGEAMVSKGVAWNLGKIFWGDRPQPIYQFDLLPLSDQRRPAFINLQQYHAEAVLIAALQALPNVELRWGHEVISVQPRDDGVDVKIRCQDGEYDAGAEWLVACDGSRSSVRQILGFEFEGRDFEDNFLIADIKMSAERPVERWFWFDPPFNRGRCALLHKQPDEIWRVDFQLGREIDRDSCVQPENVEPLLRGMLGPDVEFTPEWYSVYTFQCRRLAKFVHGRVIFAGDSAHLVSPFGARGCNGGVADADNLGWKLDLVLKRLASADLLESYDYEAGLAADENILASCRSTDFLSPKSVMIQAFRDAALELASEHQFARPLVNSGRLSTAISYPESSLNTRDDLADDWRGVAPGSPAPDAPLGSGWVLERLGDRFVLLAQGWEASVPDGVEMVDVSDERGTLLAERYDLRPGSSYLIRPDHYVTGRWRTPDAEGVAKALKRAMGSGQ